jgi:5,10-methylene-tetrahydrofolate dehydrogenase/methenyl tetrahydrofolate cyclohydrolase
MLASSARAGACWMMHVNVQVMSAETKAQLRGEVRRSVEQQGQAPGLAIVRVGGDAASGVYSKAILRVAEDVGINARLEHLPVNTSADELRVLLVQLNNDQAVHGILVQKNATVTICAAQAMRAGGVATGGREKGF